MLLTSGVPLCLFLYITIHFVSSKGEESDGTGINKYAFCDVRDPITTRQGSFYLSYGNDCTQLLLAPKGWRIRILVHELNLYLSVHDGGTASGTKSHQYTLNDVPKDETWHSTSNAMLLHADAIRENNRNPPLLNISYTMFYHSPERCGCPQVIAGHSLCHITTDFYRDDSLKRICTTTCNNNLGIYHYDSARYPVSTHEAEWRCGFDENKPINETQWDGVFHGKYGVIDQNLITCGKVEPEHGTINYLTFNVNTTCANTDLDLMQKKISEHLVDMRKTDTSYVGKCFKFKNMSANSECTVERLSLVCELDKLTSTTKITVYIADNVNIDMNNETITAQAYRQLVTNYKDLNNLANFTTQELGDEYTVTNFIPNIHGALATCPDSKVITYNQKTCVACPRHYVERYTFQKLYSTCVGCKPDQHREPSQKECVNGSRNYANHSLSFCSHVCALGKYFNNESGICEWCPFGSYQDSTTAVNPKCKPCLGGNSTGFVGATTKSECTDLCKAGEYLRGVSCEYCPIATYMPRMDNRFHRCYSCPSGTTTISVGAQNITDCYEKCKLGQYFDIGKSVCTLCPNNTYQDVIVVNNTRECKSCPLDTITASVGSTKLSDCIGPCIAGQYADLTRKKCMACPKNTYMELTSHASLKCKDCGNYKVTDRQGSTNMSDCIYTCGQGSFFNTSTEVCEKCPMDTFQDDKGKDHCKPCDGDSFTVKTGSVECITPCSSGRYLNTTAEKCQVCPIGYYQNETNHRLTSCKACTLDTYNNQTGQAGCTRCPGQEITVITAAENIGECIERCQPGNFLNISRKLCQGCQKGSYQTQANHRLEKCVQCPFANLTTLEIGATKLKDCVGYCATSPCSNGGTCKNIDYGFNCSCPEHLEGDTCGEISDVKDVDEVDVAIRFTDMKWNRQLANKESKEFMELKNNVETNAREELSGSNIRTVTVVGFTEGSVIANVELKYVALNDFKTPVDTLTTSMSDGKLGNLTVDNSSVEILNYTCTQPLGMEDGRIPDNAITSPNEDSFYPPSNARLNRNQPGWAPQVLYIEDAYLQVDLQKEVILSGIATQGSSFQGGGWLEAYEMSYSLDGKQWIKYKGDHIYQKVFGANTDVNTVVRNDLKYPVNARYVRVFRYVHKHSYSYRIEFYGCPSPKNLDFVLPTAIPKTLPPVTTTVNTGTKTAETTIMGGTTDKTKDDDDTDVGLIVGVVIGVVAFLVLVILTVWCIKTRKVRKTVRSNSYQLKHAPSSS